MGRPGCPVSSSRVFSVIDTGLCPMRSAGWPGRSTRGPRLALRPQRLPGVGASGPVIGDPVRAPGLALEPEPSPPRPPPFLGSSLEVRPQSDMPCRVGVRPGDPSCLGRACRSLRKPRVPLSSAPCWTPRPAGLRRKCKHRTGTSGGCQRSVRT